MGRGNQRGEGDIKHIKKRRRYCVLFIADHGEKGVYAQNRNIFWQGRGEKGAGEEKKKRK